MADANSIEITFLGGASSIGASCSLLRVAGRTFVVDCGMRYSGSSPLPDLSQLAGTSVDAILVTHAHMDHTGGLPVLAQACPAAPVFATPPTIDLVQLLLRDSLRLMNSPDRESEVPLYSQDQVDHLIRSLVPIKYHQPVQVGEIEICWLPASHILGAAMIRMRTPAGTILFTGDYSVSAQQTVPALSRPDFQADLVITESTYGERLHEDRNAAEQRLLGQIGEVVGRGGRVLIPAFAVGRAQEVLLILKRALRNGGLAETPVFVDGMVRAVCDVYRSHEPYVSRVLAHEIRRTPHAFYTDAIQAVACREDRARVLDTSPCIIVASSGMLTGGPSAGYCQELVRNPKDAVLLTGYQDEESPGRALLNLAQSEGPKQLRLGQATVPVACLFGTYGLSAHADRMQMVSLIEATSPRTVVLVHGEEAAKQALAASLQCRDVVCARDGLTIRRSYPPRRGSQRRTAVAVPTADDLDLERIRNLLGPPGAAPLRAAAVAEAWFGQAVERADVERFARLLESVGLVRRDDHRRDRLWVLGVQESRLFPQEAEREEQLKQQNPKGRLLEFCMRMRIDPPLTEIQPRGAFYEARMSLQFGGQTLQSGPLRAAAKKTAEQMAALDLLEQVSRCGEDTAEEIPDEEARRLQASNPKGRLLEWCARAKMGPPRFEQSPSAQGYSVRAVLDVGPQQLATAWHVAAKLKTAEHAAAEALLQQLTGPAPADDPPHVDRSLRDRELQPLSGLGAADAPLRVARSLRDRSSEPPSGLTAADESDAASALTDAAEPAPAASSGRPPLMILNELVQAGLLQGTGFDLLDQSGPSHQPTFRMVAWATTAEGQDIRTPPVAESSKKAAQRTAADQLLNLLVQRGITRR